MCMCPAQVRRALGAAGVRRGGQALGGLVYVLYALYVLCTVRTMYCTYYVLYVLCTILLYVLYQYIAGIHGQALGGLVYVLQALNPRFPGFPNSPRPYR
jgi:hypothetical protein